MRPTQSATIQSIALHELIVDGETLLNLGSTILVKSQSTDGAWYVVEDNRCTCPGFTHRGRCRHLAPAMLAAELDRVNATPVEAVAAEPVVMTSYFRKLAGAYLNGEYR